MVLEWCGVYVSGVGWCGVFLSGVGWCGVYMSGMVWSVREWYLSDVLCGGHYFLCHLLTGNCGFCN